LLSKRKINRKRGSVPLRFDKTPGCANTSKSNRKPKRIMEHKSLMAPTANADGKQQAKLTLTLSF
jgi:hypothetical protein